MSNVLIQRLRNNAEDKRKKPQNIFWDPLELIVGRHFTT